MRQSCELLLQSTLPRRVRLMTLDTTQVTVPPPGFIVRLGLAARRCMRFMQEFRRGRPRFVMVFASGGASFVDQFAVARGMHITRNGQRVDTVSLADTQVAMQGLAKCLSQVWAGGNQGEGEGGSVQLSADAKSI